MGAEVGGREGGDKEVQTNKHSNPKSASARSARPEVVRADAPGGTGRGGRAAERDSGGRGRRQGPGLGLTAASSRAPGQSFCAQRLPSGFSSVFIYIFFLAPARSRPALLSTPFSRSHSRLPLTPALTPRPPQGLGREGGGSRVSGLEGRRQGVTGLGREEGKRGGE